MNDVINRRLIIIMIIDKKIIIFIITVFYIYYYKICYEEEERINRHSRMPASPMCAAAIVKLVRACDGIKRSRQVDDSVLGMSNLSSITTLPRVSGAPSLTH